MHPVRFLATYHGHMVALLTGHAIAAFVAIWEHAHGDAVGGWWAWGLFVVLLYFAAFRMNWEQAKKHAVALATETSLRLSEREEFLEVIQQYKADIEKERQNLEIERDNLSFSPQIVLEYVADSFFVNNRGAADGRSIYVKHFQTTNFVLTSDKIHYLKAGSPSLPLIMHIEPKDPAGMHRGGDGLRAFEAIAEDLEFAMHPADSSAGPVEILNEWVKFAQNRLILVMVCVLYSDLSGREYESWCEIEWCPLIGEVQGIRPKMIQRIGHAAIDSTRSVSNTSSASDQA
jgi:hypothetical protein